MLPKNLEIGCVILDGSVQNAEVRDDHREKSFDSASPASPASPEGIRRLTLTVSLAHGCGASSLSRSGSRAAYCGWQLRCRSHWLQAKRVLAQDSRIRPEREMFWPTLRSPLGSPQRSPCPGLLHAQALANHSMIGSPIKPLHGKSPSPRRLFFLQASRGCPQRGVGWPRFIVFLFIVFFFFCPWLICLLFGRSNAGTRAHFPSP